jgi:hypothetical protein
MQDSGDRKAAEELIWMIGTRVTDDVVTPEKALATEQIPPGLALDCGRTALALPDGRAPAILTGNRHYCPEGTEEVLFRVDLPAGFYRFEFGFFDHAEVSIEEVNRRYPLSRGNTLGEPFSFDGKLRRERVELYLRGNYEQAEAEQPERILRFIDIDEIENAGRQAYVELLVDERLVDSLEILYGRFVRTGDNRFVPRVWKVTFFVEEDGPHTFCLRALNRWSQFSPNHVFDFCMTERLHATHYGLSKVAPPVPSNAFAVSLPGRSLHDFWAYELCYSFMRPNQEEVGPEVFKAVADESFQWGATHMDLYWSDCRTEPYPPGSKCGHPMPWSPDDELKGGAWYNQVPGSLWNSESLEDFTRYCHGKGMTVDWYQHLPMSPAEIDGEQFNGWDPPEWWRQNFLAKIARDFADIIRQRWRGSLDCYQEESGQGVCTPDILGQLHALWTMHPGMAMAETYAFGTQRIVPGILPNFIEVPTNSHFFHDHLRNGNLRYAPQDSVFGRQHTVLQANARAAGDPWLGEERADRALGMANPDMVLQQANDWFRPNAGDDPYFRPFGIWWLAESPNVLPDDLRNYVRGISMWPVRCAVALELTTLGRGGSLDRATHLHPLPLDPREDHEAGAMVFGNNYFRAYLGREGRTSDLEFDPRGLASFGRASSGISLLHDLFSTHAFDGPIDLRTEQSTQWVLLEKAGYLARLQQTNEVTIPYAGQSYVETRTWQTVADSPWMHLEIRRTRTGLDEDIKHCWPGKRLSQCLQIPRYHAVVLEGTEDDSALCVRLEDPRGLLPPVLVQVRGENLEVHIVPWRRLEFSCRAGADEHLSILASFEVAWMAEHSPAERWGLCEPATPETLSRPALRPEVRIARVERTDSQPYYVREGEGWMFRGAQVSDEFSACDYVLTYRRPGESTALAPFGFLENTVRAGWGCQNMLRLREIARDANRVSLTVDVLSTHPMIFAPRLQFIESVAGATINAEPWFYLDEEVLYLPTRVGAHRVELTLGECRTPCLLSTYGVPSAFRWDEANGIFSCRLALPPQTDRLPVSASLYAAVLVPPGWTAPPRDGRIVRREEHGLVVRCGEALEVRFSPRKSAPLPKKGS